MIETLQSSLKSLIESIGATDNVAVIIFVSISIAILILLSVFADLIAKKILISVIQKLVKKSKSKWDDVLLEKKFFQRIAHFAPALVNYFTIELILGDHPVLVKILISITYIYMIVVFMLALDSFLESGHAIYNSHPKNKGKSIKSYVQVIKIVLYSIGSISIFAILLDKEVGSIFAGLGAIAAVLLLVFKDSILGLVGGVQLSANDMVKVGDWIEMPSRKADGDVLEITLNTVKVQNWDRTITTIPTYALVNESFINWRGMSDGDGRRIKRSVFIDMKSIKFCTPELLNKFSKIQYLKEYIETKNTELIKYNEENNIDNSVLVNGRRMTNVGTFRKYIEAYLNHHPEINKNMTFLVRQLAPSEKGLPIEIYVFCKDKRWAHYESIQSDIFDHILAVAPEFDLRIFQNPTGDDFQKLL